MQGLHCWLRHRSSRWARGCHGSGQGRGGCITHRWRQVSCTSPPLSLQHPQASCRQPRAVKSFLTQRAPTCSRLPSEQQGAAASAATTHVAWPRTRGPQQAPVWCAGSSCHCVPSGHPLSPAASNRAPELQGRVHVLAAGVIPHRFHHTTGDLSQSRPPWQHPLKCWMHADADVPRMQGKVGRCSQHSQNPCSPSPPCSQPTHPHPHHPPQGTHLLSPPVCSPCEVLSHSPEAREGALLLAGVCPWWCPLPLSHPTLPPPHVPPEPFPITEVAAKPSGSPQREPGCYMKPPPAAVTSPSRSAAWRQARQSQLALKAPMS